jgi:hypothetical protein
MSVESDMLAKIDVILATERQTEDNAFAQTQADLTQRVNDLSAARQAAGQRRTTEDDAMSRMKGAFPA